VTEDQSRKEDTPVGHKGVIHTQTRASAPCFLIALAIACLAPSLLYGQYTITTIAGNGSSIGPSTPASLQLVFNDLAAGVSLENAAGMFNGSPFITLPAGTTLSPGQSVAVSVQFSDPGNSRIMFIPVVYSGSL